MVLRARVSEYFNQTQLSSASLVRKLATGLDVNTDVEVTDAVPPADLAAANRFWERHEGARMRVRAGSGAISGRATSSPPPPTPRSGWSTATTRSMKRADPYARRVFRDPHPLDNDRDPGCFDNGNGQRILLGSLGVKATAGDDTALLPPARTFDTLTDRRVRRPATRFSKYSVQAEAVAFTPGADPSLEHTRRSRRPGQEYAVATFNVENLYDFRDDPFDGCDFTGNSGLPRRQPAVRLRARPARPAYQARLRDAGRPDHRNDLHAPDLILVQEAEDQDICSVLGGAAGLRRHQQRRRRAGHPPGAGAGHRGRRRPGVRLRAYDRDRGGRPRHHRGVPLPHRPAVAGLATGRRRVCCRLDAGRAATGRPGLPYNADVQNPKALNAVLPADVDTSTGVDGDNVFTRAPAGRAVHCGRRARLGTSPAPCGR